MNCLSCINDYYLIISTNNCIYKTEKDIYDKEEEKNNEKKDDNYKEIKKNLSQRTSPYFYVFLTIFLLSIILTSIIICTKCWRVINDCNICEKNKIQNKNSKKQEDFLKNKKEKNGILPNNSYEIN